MREFILLVLAAALEVVGDALIRGGLKSGGTLLMLAGAIALVAYGFFVNFTALNFSKLMGLYIVLFFLISQGVAVIVFKERLPTAVLVGGSLIVAGGAVITFWH